GAGEADVYLGSLNVTTDGFGQAAFNIPYSPPADRPIVTATATDPEGNTSEVSPLRRGALEAPTGLVRLFPGQSTIFSSAMGNAIILRDPEAGPFDLTWDLTLSVTAGSLALSTTDGLAGFGDGTGTLHYAGRLTALNAALDGLRYTSPQGPYGKVMLSVVAQS